MRSVALTEIKKGKKNQGGGKKAKTPDPQVKKADLLLPERDSLPVQPDLSD